MRSAFAKGVARSIRGTLGRFLAIMGIVALGCGFFAGLQMCGPDMRAAGDVYYDGTNLWDLRLISTLGFSDDDVRRVEGIDGVEAAMPSITFDAMAHLGNEQGVVRLGSLDVDDAQASTAVSAYEVSSKNDAYLNRPFLREGTWPSAPDECVASADDPSHLVGVGDTVTLLYGTSDLDDVVKSKELRVVGTVSSSNYPYTGSFGSTTLGSGMVDQYVYLAPDAFVDSMPYTEIYVKVEGAAAEASESDDYFEVLDKTKPAWRTSWQGLRVPALRTCVLTRSRSWTRSAPTTSPRRRMPSKSLRMPRRRSMTPRASWMTPRRSLRTRRPPWTSRPPRLPTPRPSSMPARPSTKAALRNTTQAWRNTTTASLSTSRRQRPARCRLRSRSDSWPAPRRSWMRARPSMPRVWASWLPRSQTS